ncbi:PREDICTED: serine/arginine-rich splicing factor RS41-like, partial [Vollenhovia emeryi]|uniref:serine/arginine-rich splicing factor RS41-like n=1 Tax=Vollenhovia emeryi TaxID=411798 RepID=UPI0005F396E6
MASSSQKIRGKGGKSLKDEGAGHSPDASAGRRTRSRWERRERAAKGAEGEAARGGRTEASADPLEGQELGPVPPERPARVTPWLSYMGDCWGRCMAGREDEYFYSAFRTAEELTDADWAERALKDLAPYSIHMGETEEDLGEVFPERIRGYLPEDVAGAMVAVYTLWKRGQALALRLERAEGDFGRAMARLVPPERRDTGTMTSPSPLREVRERATSPAKVAERRGASTQTPPPRETRERPTSPAGMGRGVATQTPPPWEKCDRATSPARVAGEEQSCQTEGEAGAMPPLCGEGKSAAPPVWPSGLREE